MSALYKIQCVVSAFRPNHISSFLSHSSISIRAVFYKYSFIFRLFSGLHQNIWSLLSTSSHNWSVGSVLQRQVQFLQVISTYVFYNATGDMIDNDYNDNNQADSMIDLCDIRVHPPPTKRDPDPQMTWSGLVGFIYKTTTVWSEWWLQLSQRFLPIW